MSASINFDARIHGLKAIVLENDWLHLSLLPDVGAKIYDLVWKSTDRNFLWHNPRILPQSYPIEANFDNYWCGGWDDGFPTCDACEFRGEHYPNLGELRSARWTLEGLGTEGSHATVTLGAFGPISAVQARKIVALAHHSPVVRVRYEISNLGPMPLDFIWGTHPALQANNHMILRIPARKGIVGLASDNSLGIPGQHYSWPVLETPVGRKDISRVEGIDAKTFCGHYATDLEDGWYAVEDTKTGEGFLLRFPAEQCPYLWMWLVYGGWRGYHHVIVEPWTSYPVSLAQAVEQKTHRHLERDQQFVVEIEATIYAPPETWQDGLKRLKHKSFWG